MLQINVSIRNERVVQVECNETDQIKVLTTKLNLKKPMNFFFNTVFLVNSRSFKFYGIKTGNYVYCMESSINTFKEYYFNQYQIHFLEEQRRSRELQLENTRLKDLFITKITSSRIPNRKFVRRFLQHNQKTEINQIDQKESEDTIVPKDPTAPSVDILPVFWESNQPVLA